MFPIINILGRQFGTYGLCMALGVLLVGVLGTKFGKRYTIAMEDIAIVGAMGVAFALVCGSLLYCFVTFPPELIWQKVKAFDFIFLFGSGIVFFGGLIGAVPGALIGIRIAKCKIFDLERAVVPFIPLGHGIGRIGCLLGGCCYGMEYYGPLAVYYPQNNLTGLDPSVGHFPVQPLETLVNVGICAILLWRVKKAKRSFDVLCDYMALYSVSRFSLEFLRGDAIRGIYGGLSTSQWISVGLVAIWAARLLYFYLKDKKSTT